MKDTNNRSFSFNSIDSLQEKKRRIFAQPLKVKLAFKKRLMHIRVECSEITRPPISLII